MLEVSLKKKRLLKFNLEIYYLHSERCTNIKFYSVLKECCERFGEYCFSNMKEKQ